MSIDIIPLGKEFAIQFFSFDLVYDAPIYFSFDLVDAKVEETSNGGNIASGKKDDARRQRRVLLVVLLCVGIVVLAVVLQGIRYPTVHSIDTSLREPTRIREKAAVSLATNSDDDQITSVELLKVSASTL